MFGWVNSLILIVLLILPIQGKTQQHPNWRALVVGGGCENSTVKTSNMFEPSFQSSMSMLNQLGWETSFQYDGTEWPNPISPKSQPIPFSRSRLIGALKGIIQAYKGTDDAQFMLMFNSHGSPGAHHGICLGDGTLLEVSELKPILNEMRANGIKVAVFDNSCFSGNTLNELNDPNHKNFCVMSATHASTVGYGSRALENFIASALSPGEQIKNFDGKFLFQRREFGTPDVRPSDGRISASEAFEWMKMTTGLPQYSQISDCDIKDEQLLKMVDHLAPFFILTKKLEFNNFYLKDFTDSKNLSCQLKDFSSSVSQLEEWATQFIAANSDERTNLNNPAPLSQEVNKMAGVQIELAKSFSNVKDYLADDAFFKKWDELATQADAELAIQGKEKSALFADRKLSNSVFSQIKDLFTQQTLKFQLALDGMRQVIHTACYVERTKLGSMDKALTPCEEFTLSK